MIRNLVLPLAAVFLLYFVFIQASGLWMGSEVKKITEIGSGHEANSPKAPPPVKDGRAKKASEPSDWVLPGVFIVLIVAAFIWPRNRTQTNPRR